MYLIMNRSLLYALTILSSLLLSCKGEIGDECVTDAQCRAGQSCDLISEGGYCTISDCREGECPDGSVCVNFENNDQYCMATCTSDEDCRENYYCEQSLGETPFCRQNP